MFVILVSRRSREALLLKNCFSWFKSTGYLRERQSNTRETDQTRLMINKVLFRFCNHLEVEIAHVKMNLLGMSVSHGVGGNVFWEQSSIKSNVDNAVDLLWRQPEYSQFNG